MVLENVEEVVSEEDPDAYDDDSSETEQLSEREPRERQPAMRMTYDEQALLLR